MKIPRRTAILAAISAIAGVVAPKLAGAAPTGQQAFGTISYRGYSFKITEIRRETQLGPQLRELSELTTMWKKETYKIQVELGEAFADYIEEVKRGATP